jgi:hypothetical protein
MQIIYQGHAKKRRLPKGAAVFSFGCASSLHQGSDGAGSAPFSRLTTHLFSQATPTVTSLNLPLLILIFAIVILLFLKLRVTDVFFIRCFSTTFGTRRSLRVLCCFGDMLTDCLHSS